MEAPALYPNPPPQPSDRGRGRGRGARGRGRGGRGRGPRRRNRNPSSNPSSAPPPSETTARGRGRRHRLPRGGHIASSSTHVIATPAPSAQSPAATELSERLASQMARGLVECVVCLERVRRDRPIWSCDVCYVITHLHCARKWGNQPGADDDAAQSAAAFSCPSCRAPGGDPRSVQFRCYCRRRRNPQLEPGVLPGSCGDPCLKPRGAPGSDCPHKCTALCHPGPCAPCVIPAPPMLCHCGKESIFRRCGDEVPVSGVSCGGICGKTHGECGHVCSKICHVAEEGGECDAVVDVLCYCAKTVTQLPCAHAFNGYACGERCGRQLACGNHLCESGCHQGECPPCKSSPEVIETCACGKYPLSHEQRMARTSCLDSVPSCGLVCGKSLGCLQEHTCEDACGHEGECKPCAKEVVVECRCSATVVDVICGDDLDDLRSKLICNRKCNDRLICRRHNCQAICCLFKKRKALSRPFVVPSEKIWKDLSHVAHLHGISNAERRRLGHICFETCRKRLSCGLHACDLSCGHNGDCPPCGILIREALHCACGSESIPAPVRCGTEPPRCQRPCSRGRPCGHQCNRECHPGECEPCVELLEFSCVGGHGEKRFVPCHIGAKGIRCHRACGKSLQCGVHACRNPCHSDYPRACEPSKVEGCSQPCGLARKKCDHSCTSSCHPGMLCPDTPCRELITVSCPCGRRQERSMCLRGGMGGSQEENDEVRLSCDDECTAQGRLRAFASAVGKDGAGSVAAVGSSAADNAGAVAKYSEFLLQFAEREPGMLSYFESEFARIVLGKAKKFTLQDLPQLHRLVVHTLAEFYRLESESSGRSSSRHITIRHRGVGVKPVFPQPLLSEAFSIREKEKKRSRQLGSGRALVMHVASSLKYPATAQIEARVEHELRGHVGSFRILGRSTMSSNLTGVLVEFSTSERALLARTSLMACTGITVETPVPRADVGPSAREETACESTATVSSEGHSWNEGMRYGGREELRSGLPPPPPEVVVDENVPDSWDD